MAELKDYAFVIKLAGSVYAKNEKEAWNKIYHNLLGWLKIQKL